MNIQDALQALHFMRPLWLFALPLVWGLGAWLARRRARDGDWSRLIDADLLPDLRLGANSGGGLSPWPWLLAAWTLAVLALAGPSWQQDSTTAYRAPAAWVLVLDLSPSMTSSDLSPNRVTRARYALDDLLDGARDASVGLVAFSDDAYTVAPLTDDVATVRGLLPPLSPDIMPSSGDSLAPALTRAGKLLEQSNAKDKQLVLLSDGFSDPAAALQLAASLKSSGMTLNVVGVVAPSAGTPGQIGNAGLSRDQLRQVATAGGGRYVELSQLPSLIADLNARPNRLTGANAEQGVRVAHWLDGGVWLLPGLLLLAALLARRGWL